MFIERAAFESNKEYSIKINFFVRFLKLIEFLIETYVLKNADKFLVENQKH